MLLPVPGRVRRRVEGETGGGREAGEASARRRNVAHGAAAVRGRDTLPRPVDAPVHSTVDEIQAFPDPFRSEAGRDRADGRRHRSGRDGVREPPGWAVREHETSAGVVVDFSIATVPVGRPGVSPEKKQSRGGAPDVISPTHFRTTGGENFTYRSTKRGSCRTRLAVNIDYNAHTMSGRVRKRRPRNTPIPIIVCTPSICTKRLLCAMHRCRFRTRSNRDKFS